MISHILRCVLSFYFYLIILRVFLTWIPTLDWDAQPLKILRETTDCYLDLFRRFIPPFGGLDFSPIIALMVLQLLSCIV